MLYDQPQLARVYVHAWRVTGNEFFRTISEEILDYVVCEMTAPAGGFYSTQDADPTPLRSGDDRSEGEQGKFFVWTQDEIRDALSDEADAFMAAYGVTRYGNASTGSARGFEGLRIFEFFATCTGARPRLRLAADSSKPGGGACISTATGKC
jgi:uncharacterized protein YyaL (SSP411 family)